MFLQRQNGICTDSTLSEEEKLKIKGRRIEEHKNDFESRYSELFASERYRGFLRMDVNNAYLAISMTYGYDLDIFYALYRKERYNLKSTVSRLKTLKKVKGDAKEHMKKWLLL